MKKQIWFFFNSYSTVQENQKTIPCLGLTTLANLYLQLYSHCNQVDLHQNNSKFLRTFPYKSYQLALPASGKCRAKTTRRFSRCVLVKIHTWLVSSMQMIDLKRTGAWTFQFVTALPQNKLQMRVLQSTILIQVRGEISETSSVLGSDTPVTGSAIVSHS